MTEGKGVIILLFLFSGVSSDDVEAPLVSTQLGTLEGTTELSISGKEFYSFYGIPFAQPPINDLRFKDPLPTSGWDGVRQAKTMPEYCKQAFQFMRDEEGKTPFVGEEDCLYLNVHVPKNKETSQNKLPVMVFIHGGGFVTGGAREYSPKTLMEEEIILIFVQYRLGVFGFLSTEDSAMAGNFGLMDQTLALKWVKKNIHSFGGDSERITIFGESAGAASVHYQILSPKAQGLFQRAILQSGNAFQPWARSQHHRKIAEEMGKSVNCHLKEGSEHFLSCMQAVDADDLLDFVCKTFKFTFLPNYFAPRVDGDFLPSSPQALVRDGNYSKVNIIAGITKDEGATFLDLMIPREANSLDENLSVALNFFDEDNHEDLVERTRSRFLGGGRVDLDPPTGIIKALSYRHTTLGHQILQSFLVEDPHISVYLYEIHQNPMISPFYSYLGRKEVKNPWVAHGTSLEFLFYGGGFFPVTESESEEDQIMRKLFIKFWTNFAKVGDPTPDNSLSVRWRRSDKNMSFLNVKTKPQMMENHRQKDVDWWLSLSLPEFNLLYLEDKNWDKTEL